MAKHKAKKTSSKRRQPKQRLVVASATVKLVPANAKELLGGFWGNAALGSLNSTPARHEELAVHHANEAEQLARAALAKARSGRCNNGVEDLTRASIEYGRADAHAAGLDSSEVDQRKANARGMIVQARNAIEGCVVSCKR